MKKKRITIISSRGRGMDQELKLMKDAIVSSEITPEFRYFIKQEITKNVAYAQGLKSSKKEIAKGSDAILCMDMSLNIPVEDMPADGKKILLQVPFNYMHEAALDKENNATMANKVGAAAFSHVFSFSPFGTELLHNAYDTEGIEIIEGFASPLSYHLCQEENQKKYRDILSYYYPQSKDKKILAIFLHGKCKKNPEWFLQDVDGKKLLNALPEDWFLLTDTQEVMELFRRTDVMEAPSFGYLPQILKTQLALSFTDILITNEGQFLACQAARRKPCYSMQYSDSNVERYFEKHYPELYMKEIERLENIIEHAKSQEALHDEVTNYFSYAPEVDVRDEVIQLLI